jgi:hypothetical protein
MISRREFLARMFQAGLVVATPKLIFDIGANKHHYPTGLIIDVYEYRLEFAGKIYSGRYADIVMGTPPGPNWFEAEKRKLRIQL